jgi:hypothetical protein
MRWVITGSIFVLCWVVLGLSGCAGRPVVQGFLEPGGTIYRESEQEDFGSRSTVKVRSFEF